MLKLNCHTMLIFCKLVEVHRNNKFIWSFEVVWFLWFRPKLLLLIRLLYSLTWNNRMTWCFEFIFHSTVYYKGGTYLKSLGHWCTLPWLFGCPIANFWQLSRSQPHLPNINHCFFVLRKGHQVSCNKKRLS